MKRVISEKFSQARYRIATVRGDTKELLFSARVDLKLDNGNLEGEYVTCSYHSDKALTLVERPIIKESNLAEVIESLLRNVQ